MECGAVEDSASPDVACRERELEAENARLRLLVVELLVENQRLRESTPRPHVSSRYGAPTSAKEVSAGAA